MEIEQQFRTASQFLKEGELSQAEVQYQNILKQHPNHAYVNFCLGFIHQKRGEFAGAIESYQRAIHARPNYIEAINNLGNIYERQGNLDEAIQCYQKTVELNPEESNGYRNLGFIYEKQRQWSNALACYKKLVDFEENFVEACYKTGRIYQQQGEFSKAIQSYQKVIQHQPDHAEALFGLGFIHQEQGQLAAAIAFYKQAIEFAPQLADAHNNLGNVLKQQGKFTEAIAAYQQALQLDPTHAFAHNSLGNALRYLGKSAEATVAFRQALQLKPNFAEAHSNLGNVLRDQGKLPEAIAAFRQALQLKSDYVVAHSNLIFTLNCSGDYEPSAIYQEHQQWAACQTAAMPRNMQPYNNNCDGDRRLRIGYVSSDFRTHSVAYFLEPLLANHDHSKFAIICYADNPKTDQTTQRLQEFADDWRDIVALNNEQLAKLIRQDQIDILVDLAGHTKGDRLRVFAYKPAPVQVSYLGYPSTTGLDTMDYRFTDAWADPEGQTEHLHTECLIRLPQGFLCYQPAPDCPDVKPSPALATGHVTFGSFNDLAKVSPQLIAHWSAILLAVPNAKMLIKARALADVGTRDEVYSLFKQQGIAADRVELLGRIPLPTEHLALYNQVDIALDTFPYNGTTTTCEALWMGVPVITVAGEAHVSRVGVSVLSVVGLPELITDSAEAYCQKAIALANDLEHLQALRETLRDRMQASPLMNAQLIAQSVEDAYRTMWQSWCGSAAATLGTQLRSAAQLLYGGKLEQAALQYQSVLQQDPDHAYANFCLGCVYQKQVDFARAIACYQKAIAVKPDYIEALNNLGNIYEEQKSAKAIECYQKIVELQPHKPYTYVNLGVALRFQGKLTEAIAAYRQALQLDPNFAQTHSNLGNALNDQGKFTAAIAAYRRALELNPDFPQAYNNLLFGLNYSSDYEPTEIYHEHRQWAERQAAVYPPVTQTPGRDYDAQRRLRIGYVSGDLKTHSVAYFMEPLLAAHDHDKFEIICYANNTQTDKTTQRLQQLADSWRDISPLSHEQVVALIQQDQIDILIDLSGHTKGNRLPVFAGQPAPVQISYLGYPNTTGLDTIDYRFTDAWADPEGTTEHLHTEQLVRLPHGFLCYQPAANCPDVSPLPARKTGHITFGSFNNLPKINAQIVAHWSAILLAVPASRMILKAKPLADVGTQDEIYNLFKQHGVDRDRIDLLGRIPSHPEHLALYNRVDIALDTFPYHGTTTTCEALWMGVPVITLAGPTHVSRVGVSLLTSIGFPELIAESAEAYIQTAIALANDLDRLQHLRTVLRDRVQAAPLTNAHLITQSIENAYRKMWQNLCIQESLEPDQRLVEIKGDVKVCVKDDLTSLTTYILLEQGDWFEAEMAFIRHLITPGMQILDIGANHGVYTLTMAKLLEGQGYITAYEPDLSVLQRLQKSVAANNLTTIETVNAGLSDHEGEATLFLSTNSELNSLHQKATNQQQVTIQLLALDQELERRNWQDIAFIKLDAEGEEPKILAGGQRFFSEQSPLIMFELKHGKQINLPLIQLFEQLGYDTYRLVPGLGFLMPFDVSQPVDNYQLNLFACKTDRAQQLVERNLMVTAIPEVSALPPPTDVLTEDSAGASLIPFLSHWQPVTTMAGDTEPYLKGLRYFLLAKSEPATPGIKLSALQLAFDCLQQAVQAKPTLARCCSLARVAAELGWRQESAIRLQQVSVALQKGKAFTMDEPFLPVAPQYDHQLPPDDLPDRLFVSILETYEKSRAYSSYFVPQQSATILRQVVQNPFHSSQAERRLRLAEKRLTGDRQWVEKSPSEALHDPDFQYVFCAGMQRSGSTWSYNVARLLLQHTYGQARIAAGYVGENQNVDQTVNQFSEKDKILLLKFHRATPATQKSTSTGLARTIYTYRNPFNAVASLVDFFKSPLPQAVAAIDGSLQDMVRWQQTQHALFVSFDDLTNHPQQAIRRIAKHLQLPVTEALIHEIAEQTSYEATKKQAEKLSEHSDQKLIDTRSSAYDPVSLLHVGHAPQGANRDWQTQFTSEEQHYIVQHLGRWLDDDGRLKPEFLPDDNRLVKPKKSSAIGFQPAKPTQSTPTAKRGVRISARNSKQQNAAAPKRKSTKANELIKTGINLSTQGKTQEAVECYQKALAIDPKSFAALVNLGNMLKDQGKHDLALNYYRKALTVKPNHPAAANNLAGLFKDQGLMSEAVRYFKIAAADPAFVVAHNNLLLTLNYSVDHKPADIFEEHRNWAERCAAPLKQEIRPFTNAPDPDRPLRIGYVSSDFRTHPVAYFFEPLLVNSDRQQFTSICYANGAPGDDVTDRLRPLAAEWRDINALKDGQVADLVRQDKIDILVDLAGHTSGNRLLVFAHKPAPVQVTYIGYPNTTGLDTMDYRLTDAWADPEGQTEALHTEQLVRLPQGFLCYQPPSDCPEVNPSPVLATGHITFGSFNNLAKVNPQLIGYWSAILQAIPQSRMILKSRPLANSDIRNHVSELFQQHGIEADRIELLSRIPSLQEHLALYNRVDIALDTFPYNGTTTTCEALWMGVPVMALAGQVHAARVGVSLLSLVNLEELIAASPDEYVQTAIALANDRERLQGLRTSLRDRMQQSPLTNAPLMTRSLEAAYRTMWQQWCN